MKTNARKTSEWAILAVVIILLGVIITLTLTGLSNSNHQKLLDQHSQSLDQAIDSAAQTSAIKYLSQQKGMILEIQTLSRTSIPDTVLLEELGRITSSDNLQYFDNIKNKYLDDFAFVIPDASEVGKICEDLISQIDDQIHFIEFGNKG